MTQPEWMEIRPDFAVIARWIKPHDKILDLGCGDGSLIQWLSQTFPIDALGVELNPDLLLESIRRGVAVIQADLENGLQHFASSSFDKVILSRTLQTIRQTEVVLTEMLRVGKEAIVSFPNFVYWKNLDSIFKGSMPVSEDLPYSWHDSPNLRFFTLKDFEALCTDLNIAILEKNLLNADGSAICAPADYSDQDCHFLTSLVVCRIGRA